MILISMKKFVWGIAMSSNKTYKVTVSMDDYETEIEDCDSEDEAIQIVLRNYILGCGMIDFEVEEVADEL